MSAKQLNFMGAIWQEGNMYTAYCPELDLTTCGHTVEEARRNLRQVIEIFLEETAEMGTQRELLAEAGYDLDLPTVDAPRQLIAFTPLQVSLTAA